VVLYLEPITDDYPTASGLSIKKQTLLVFGEVFHDLCGSRTLCSCELLQGVNLNYHCNLMSWCEVSEDHWI
jgi:hypothetical protein